MKKTCRFALASLLATSLLAAGCGGGGGGASSTAPTPTPVAGDSFDRRALLASVADRVVLPALRRFATEAAGLAAATDALTAAPLQRDAARAAWRSAMQAWQTVEVLQFGPAGSTMMMGGRALRDEFYSWPLVNPCRIDQETVRGTYADTAFFTTQLVNVRGLDALEYLLFAPDDTNACSPSVDINAGGGWQALVNAGDVAARRAAYAARAAADVAARAAALRDAWEPGAGNFAAQLATAGAGSSVYPTAQGAVDDVFAALFFVELVVKDEKLAAPAGIVPDCTTDVCPNLAESQWADVAKEEILANLGAARQLFLGGADSAGTGFDDFLRARGAAALATTMLAALDAAVGSFEAIPGTMLEALASDPDAVRDAHAAVKNFTDSLKTQFVTVLNLTIPQEGAGDND
jgi:predicted lipoprotein